MARKTVDVKSRMEELILGPSSARSEMIRRRLNGMTDGCLSLVWFLWLARFTAVHLVVIIVTLRSSSTTTRGREYQLFLACVWTACSKLFAESGTAKTRTCSLLSLMSNAVAFALPDHSMEAANVVGWNAARCWDWVLRECVEMLLLLLLMQIHQRRLCRRRELVWTMRPAVWGGGKIRRSGDSSALKSLAGLSRHPWCCWWHEMMFLLTRCTSFHWCGYTERIFFFHLPESIDLVD